MKTKKQTKESINFIQLQYKERGIGRFAVIEKSTNEFIGWSGLKLNSGEKEKLNNLDGFIDIGYRFIPNSWRKGYAIESSIAALDYGFHTMNYDIIYGVAELNNIASNRVLKKIGLHFSNEFLYNEIKCN